jgi:hypothetical protein
MRHLVSTKGGRKAKGRPSNEDRHNPPLKAKESKRTNNAAAHNEPRSAGDAGTFQGFEDQVARRSNEFYFL